MYYSYIHQSANELLIIKTSSVLSIVEMKQVISEIVYAQSNKRNAGNLHRVNSKIIFNRLESDKL